MSKTHTRVMQQTGIDASSYLVSNDIAYNIVLDLVEAIKSDAVNPKKLPGFRESMRLLLRDLDGEIRRALRFVEQEQKEAA